ncbi:NAD(P)/FAD-dependent oxidoreductase [Methanolapillus millepedarum]|uniref:Amine oxidase domain-containing protein n=1 Tax=Methanolapillus millepedarum TaxID=3028296 RepID=A0AA96V216_9EURY|nr:hypothetical protein MsAc7_05670 [Methanosarcinaceae archaeon Ac7]
MVENASLIPKKPTAIVIGAGLGGLLAAAHLSKKGYQVDVYERLALIGGRFMNIEYQGYQLSTGALHMLPHGNSGPLANMLFALGADVTVIPSIPMATVRIPKNVNDTDYTNGFMDIPHVEFKKHLKAKNKLMMILLTFGYKARLIRPKNEKFKTWYSQYIQDDRIDRCADSFAGWALSTTADEVSTEEMFAIFDNVYKYGGPGIVVGGCQSIIDELVRIIRENGGNVHAKKEVTKIIVNDGKAAGVAIGNDEIYADLIVSDIGHAETWEICDPEMATLPGYDVYMEKLKSIEPSAGLKICFAIDEPMITHGGVLLTPYTRRINGMNEVTNADPNLAPPGKHLVMAHQRTALDRLDKIEEEIDLGLADLKDLFPGKTPEILMIQVHHGKWPVNRAFSGQDFGNKTLISNLFIVGDGAKGQGGIEVEGIALGVENAMKDIADWEKSNNKEQPTQQKPK